MALHSLKRLTPPSVFEFGIAALTGVGLEVNMQMQPDELQQLQERMAQLEQENTAFQAEVTDLRQRELALQAQAIAVQDRATELATFNAALQAELLLQQQTETTLHESEHCFRNAFEQAVMGMTITDLEGHWVHINPYAYNMLGYTETEMWAFTCADVTDPNTQMDDRALVQRLVSSELPAYQTEKRYRCKDGSWLWASLTSSLIRDAAGNPAYLISIVQDISQRKEAESALLDEGMNYAGTGTSPNFR